ncbi:MAG TPA: hypothetical protein VFC46_07370, partial [Humisphaera sp.]|nr:hypothetical protein [Humisphaera sp.]
PDSRPATTAPTTQPTSAPASQPTSRPATTQGALKSRVFRRKMPEKGQLKEAYSMTIPEAANEYLGGLE